MGVTSAVMQLMLARTFELEREITEALLEVARELGQKGPKLIERPMDRGEKKHWSETWLLVISTGRG